jgi:hybrid cluster-associated redox disulfide protein
MDQRRNEEPIRRDDPVRDIIEHFPETIPVFVTHGLHCVGCWISPFHTIADSAREYGADLEPLLGALNRVAAARESPGQAQ